jgi:hypothetical protein
MSLEQIEYKFKHEELTYREALEAVRRRGLSPRMALDIVGRWNQDVMGGRS